MNSNSLKPLENNKHLENRIFVTRTFLPDIEIYKDYIEQIFKNNWVTNNGTFVRKLEKKLRQFLKVKNLIPVANGTLALQVAYKALDLKGEVITTPFSFVATVNSLIWLGLKPVFADINPETLCIEPKEIEKKITKNTSAIVATHVFGNICDVEEIEKIAKKYSLKIIYDAAHAFNVTYRGKSVLNYGDISILSFHATKLFHTIEGGALITNNDRLAKKIKKLINFGIENEEKISCPGINAKMNEFEAAMGLCLLEKVNDLIEKRKIIYEYYKENLKSYVKFQKLNKDIQYNYAYCPVIFKNETELKRVKRALNAIGVYPRRYFYPSLDSLNYIQTKQYCFVARDISKRIMCLPLYPELTRESQDLIISTIKKVIS